MNGGEKMYPKEQQFANLLTKQKRKWIYNSQRFKIDNTHYRPDFYLPDEKLYIEVVGTRQAYHANKNKILKFKTLYPHIRFIIVDFENNLLPLSKIKKFPISPLNSPLKYKLVEYYDTIIPLTTEHHRGQCEVNNKQICITCKSIRNYWRRKRYYQKIHKKD